MKFDHYFFHELKFVEIKNVRILQGLISSHQLYLWYINVQYTIVHQWPSPDSRTLSVKSTIQTYYVFIHIFGRPVTL